MLAVFTNRLVASRNAWVTSLLGTFVMPLLFLLGIGLSVGSYVNRTGNLGVSYVDFIAPGVLASTALQVTIGETTYSIMAAFQWDRSYDAMRATPVSPRAIMRGEGLWVLLRVGISALGFLIIMVAFGTVHSWWALAVIPVALLLGLATGLPVLAFTASIRSDNAFAMLFRFVVIPMTLFAGVFFPVTSMPVVFRVLAYVSPLWHGVELCRAATLGVAPPWPAGIHLAYLALWVIVGYLLAARQYGRRMAD